jgi:hypothetical protein
MPDVLERSGGCMDLGGPYAVEGADFWIFWIFNRWQPAADVKCYSKTKVEKAFFFISCLPLGK